MSFDVYMIWQMVGRNEDSDSNPDYLQRQRNRTGVRQKDGSVQAVER